MEYNYSIGGEVYVKKNLIKEKVYTYIIEITLVLIGVISIIFTIVYLKSCELKMKAFICASITTLIIVSIYSVILFKKETSNKTFKNKYPILLGVIWNYTLVISFIFIYYKVLHSKAIILDKNYWVCNLITSYIILLFLFKYIIRFLE
jgi:hypothetical protein